MSDKFPSFDAYDPGKDYVARVRFVLGLIVQADLLTLPNRQLALIDRWRSMDACVIEQVVTRGADEFMKSGKRPQDTLDVSRKVGYIESQYERGAMIRPHTVPKKIWQKRVWDAMTPAERAVFPTQKTKLKHLLDAAGVGFKYLGRL